MRSRITASFVFLAFLTCAVAICLARQQPPDKRDPAAGAGAAGAAPAQAGDFPDFVISEMRVQEFPERTYLYVQHETTLAEIGPVVQQSFEQLMEPIMSGEVQVLGAPIFVYKGATGEMNKPFELQIGWPVADNTKEVGDLKVRKLEKYRCATVLYSGSMQNIAQAYMKIMPELMQAGLQPSGDSREMHLYHETPDSPNNIVLIMVGVK
jgi:effector-binding domain-containing protein